MIHAICTWGFGDDVCLVIDSQDPLIPALLLQDPIKTSPNPKKNIEPYKYKHGIVTEAQISLNSDQAIDLGTQLIKAGIQARALNGVIK